MTTTTTTTTPALSPAVAGAYMTEPIRISAAALRFVLPHVSKEVSRPGLAGVLLERCGVIVATNGHSLVAHRFGAEHVQSDLIVRFHKPKEVTGAKVATIVLDAIRWQWASVVSPVGSVSNRSARLLDEYGGVIGVSLFDIVENQFPNWRAIMPIVDDFRTGTLEEGRIALDPELLARFQVKGAGPIMLRPCGSTRAVAVTFPHNPDACGTAMPCRPVGLGTIPEWAYPADAIKAAS